MDSTLKVCCSRHARANGGRMTLIGSLAVVAALIVGLGTVGPVQAAVFQCPSADVACLIAAINTANGTGADDTITLEAGTYLLTAVDNETDGPNGLPSITSPLTIRGAGADMSIIERADSAARFRILHVSAAGTLTLEGLTMKGGFLAFDVNGAPALGGGGLFNVGTLTISHSAITDNLVDEGDGGGLVNAGTMTITDSTISGNHVAGDFGDGGGLVNAGTMTISDSTISGNDAGSGSLGGIDNRGLLTITNSTVTRNLADIIGGIGNDGTLTLMNSSIDRNGAVAIGGIDNRGTLTITNSTVASNGGGFRDGGIDNSGTLTITNSTIAGNRASIDGGGLVNTEEAIATLQHTILALNTADFDAIASDCVGPLTSLGLNLMGSTAGCTITLQASDLTGEPGLLALADDGAPGRGHLPLLPVSRAIDAGSDAACPPTDQLGQPRVGICDIGAIEFQHMVVVVNASVTFEPIQATFTFTPDPFACSRVEEFVGTFSFEARLTNASERALTDLVVGVTTLTNGNLLQNADIGPRGVGSGLTVPRQEGFSDGVLSPDEVVDVPFLICVTARAPFTFVVEVFGVSDAGIDAQARVWALPK
jgi:hypothetical protein